MGTPNDDAVTRTYEEYAFHGLGAAPEPPEGYDVPLAFLQKVQDAFVQIDHHLIDYVPLRTLVPEQLASELGIASDMLVVSVINSDDYGLNVHGTETFTQLGIMLMGNGKWLVHVIGAQHELHVLNDAADLTNLLTQHLGKYGELRDRWSMVRNPVRYIGRSLVDTGDLGVKILRIIEEAIKTAEAHVTFAKTQSEAIADMRHRMGIWEF